MTATPKTYTATAERSRDWWAITIEGVPFAHTQTRRLDQVEAIVRELLVDLDVESDPNAFSVEVKAEAGFVGDLIEQVHDARRAAQEAAAEAAEATSTVVVELRDKGYSTRDIGVLLGLSYQRVSQITTKRRAAGGYSSSGKKSRQLAEH